jgi:predicted transcriptional regulator
VFEGKLLVTIIRIYLRLLPRDCHQIQSFQNEKQQSPETTKGKKREGKLHKIHNLSSQYSSKLKVSRITAEGYH